MHSDGRREKDAQNWKRKKYKERKAEDMVHADGKRQKVQGSDGEFQFYKMLKVFFSSTLGILSSDILDDQILKEIVPHSPENSNFLEKIFYKGDELVHTTNEYLNGTIPFLTSVVAAIEKYIKDDNTRFPHVFWFYDMCNNMLKKLEFRKDSVLKNPLLIPAPPPDERLPEVADEGKDVNDYIEYSDIDEDVQSYGHIEVAALDMEGDDIDKEVKVKVKEDIDGSAEDDKLVNITYFQDNFSLMEIGVKQPIIYNISTNHMKKIYEEYGSKLHIDMKEKLLALNWSTIQQKNEAIINYENYEKKHGTKVYNKKLKSKRKSRRHKIKIITKPKTRRAKKSSNLMKDKKKGVKTKTKTNTNTNTKTNTNTNTKKRKKSKSKLPISKKIHHKAIKKGGGILKSLKNFVEKSYDQLLVLLNLRDKEDPSASVPLLIDLNNSIEGPEFPYIHELIKNKGFVCLIVTSFTPMTPIENDALKKYKIPRDVNIGKVYIIKAKYNFKGLKIAGSKELIKAKMILDSDGTERTLYETSHIQYGDKKHMVLGFDEKIETPLGEDGTLSNGETNGIIILKNNTILRNIGTIYIVKPYDDSWSKSDSFLDWDMYGFIRNVIGKKTCEGRKIFILFCIAYSRYFDNYVNGFKRNPDKYFGPWLDNYILKHYYHLSGDEKSSIPIAWWVPIYTKREIFREKTIKLIEGLTQGCACKTDIVVEGKEDSHRYYRGIRDKWVYPFNLDTRLYKEKGFFSVTKSCDKAADFSKSQGFGQGHICIIWRVEKNMPYIVMDEEKSRLPEEKEVLFQSPIIKLIWDQCGFYNGDWKEKWKEPQNWNDWRTNIDLDRGSDRGSDYYINGYKKILDEEYEKEAKPGGSMYKLFEFFRTRYQKKVIFVELKYDEVDKADHEQRRIESCTPVKKLIGIVDEYI